MPRRGRLHIPGGCYHIIGRGLERRFIFDAIEDYEEFLSQLRYNLEQPALPPGMAPPQLGPIYFRQQKEKARSDRSIFRLVTEGIDQIVYPYFIGFIAVFGGKGLIESMFPTITEIGIKIGG